MLPPEDCEVEYPCLAFELTRELVVMTLIFPGMDPYLEDRRVWPGVHNRMIVYIADRLGPLLSPRYAATIEERVYIERSGREFVPDVLIKRLRDEPEAKREPGGLAVAEVVEAADEPITARVVSLEIHESYVSIIDLRNKKKVVAALEVVSPSNKSGAGRKSYRAKQRETLRSDVHLIEIDLLRTGKHVLAIPEAEARARCGPYDALCSVNRARDDRSLYELYPGRLRDRLPKVGIPLAEGDADATLDVQAILAQTYENGGYRDLLPYDSPCFPALSSEDQAWAFDRIQAESKSNADQSP